MRYDTVNMLRHTTDEPNLEIKRLKEYVKHLQQKVKELYKQVELNELTNKTPQRHQVNKCYNPIDNIIINEYIKTCTSRMTEMLKTKPLKYFKTKQRKILRTIHDLQKDPTIIIKPADKNLGLVIMDTTTYIKAGEDKLTKTNNYKSITTEILYKEILKEVIDILIEAKS